MNKCSGKPNRKGNMPFALLAVSILLIASAYCVVSANITESEKETEEAHNSLGALNNSVEETEMFVERGLGEILFDICTSPDMGTLSERSKVFRERADTWIRFQFPVQQSGVTVYLENYDLKLQSEKFQMGSDNLETNGYVPSFLKATGQLTATYVSDSGKMTRTFQISTDGSCALPLTLEMGSLFENALSNNGTVLYQMVKYQLTSLAQHRVLNGYGAMSQYGPKGTNSILTDNDVKEAYLNSIRALECMYFRDSAGNEYFGSTDLAKEIISNDGYIEIDLNAVYAQALSAKVDDIVGKWFDYFLGNVALNIFDSIEDALDKAWNSLTSFITGKNNFSAEPYIRNVAGDLYTGIRTGDSFVFYVQNPSTGELAEYNIDYPDVDLYGSDTIRNFKNHYNSDNNRIRDWLYMVVNTAIKNIADGKGLNVIRVNANDDGDYAELVSESIIKALDGDMKSFETVAEETIKSNGVPDQFYAAIYDSIYRDRDDIFTYSDEAFNKYIMSQVSENVIRDFGNSDHPHAELDAVDILGKAFNLEQNVTVRNEYKKEVDRLMERLDGLNTVAGSGSKIIEKGCIAILQGNFLSIDVICDIEKVAKAMCSEYSENIAINPYSGFTDIPDEDSFTLRHENLILKETLSVSDRSNASITVGKPSDKSTHEVGFEESKYASYCTVFPVTIKDSFVFEVQSTGTLLQALGMCDSAYRNTVHISLSIDVPVVSGWGLIGVEYASSTNFFSDLFDMLLKALEPLLEPLRKLMEMAENVMDKISQAIMVISQYMTDYLEMLYNAIIEPIERLNNLFLEKLTEVFCEQIINFSDGASAIVDVSVVGQTLGFTYMGYTVKFTFNLATLEKYTKNIVKAEFEGNVAGADVSAYVNVKTKGETNKTVHITAGFSIKGDSWDLKGTVDPKMSSKHLVTLSGTVSGVKIDATIPEAVQYNEIGISLSDIPGINAILQNIPSPIPGTKVEIDAGISLKYNVPIETGVLINEFESNPEGTDADHEWAEIINLSGTSVDLNNWTITTSKNKVHIIKDVELAIGERAVIHFPGTFLLNTKEYLVLKDPDGEEVDRSATMSDGANDNKTCQRGMDGSTEWSLIKGTCGERNVGGLFGENGMATNIIKNIVEKAALKAMTELRHVYTVEALQDLLTRTVLYAVDDGINRLANCMVEGSIWVSADFTDVSSTGHYGFRTYVMVDKEIVGDILKYLLGKAEALFLGISDPYNIQIETIQYDDVYVGMSVYGAIKPPKLLCASKSSEDKVMIGSDISCNISGLAGLFDCDIGTPKVKSQIGIKNCPYEMIPKSMGMKKNMTYDYWFMRIVFTGDQ
ncbi:MAG: lamin tail domain-containing protein [archaeon]|nr:lamin tail domain-containing protein [archaeon]